LKRVHDRWCEEGCCCTRVILYKPSAIEGSAPRPVGAERLGQVSVQIARGDASGGVPITFKIVERLRHAVA